MISAKEADFNAFIIQKLWMIFPAKEMSQRAHGVKMTSYQRRCDVIDVDLTSCACWGILMHVLCITVVKYYTWVNTYNFQVKRLKLEKLGCIWPTCLNSVFDLNNSNDLHNLCLYDLKVVTCTI